MTNVLPRPARMTRVLRQLLPSATYEWIRDRRRRWRQKFGRLHFGPLHRLTPVSRHFGFERGTPVDRFYIERFLGGHGGDIRGRVLEVGDDAYTRRFGGTGVTGCDVLHVEAGHPHATIVADLASAEHVPADTFDCFICTQTLHLLYDIPAAVRTIHRILAPGGVCLATVPGISPLEADGWRRTWYWALTELSARRLFEESFRPHAVDVTSHGNVLAACAFLQGLASEELKPQELAWQDPQFPLLITIRAVKAGGIHGDSA